MKKLLAFALTLLLALSCVPAPFASADTPDGITVDGDLSDGGWANTVWHSRGFWQNHDADHPVTEGLKVSYAVRADGENICVAIKVNEGVSFVDRTYQTGATNFRLWFHGDGMAEEGAPDDVRAYYDVTWNGRSFNTYYMKAATERVAVAADTQGDSIRIEIAVKKEDINVSDAFGMMVTYSSPTCTEGDLTAYNAYHVVDAPALPGGWNSSYLFYDQYRTQDISVGEIQGKFGGNNQKGPNAGVLALTVHFTQPESQMTVDSSLTYFPAGNEASVISSEEANLRWAYVLAVDAEGRIVAAAQNIFRDGDPNANLYPARGVPVPAGGYAIVFHCGDGASTFAHEGLKDYFRALLAASEIENTEGCVSDVSALGWQTAELSLSGGEYGYGCVTLYRGAVPSDDEEPDDPEESGESEGSSEEISSEPEDSSEEISAEPEESSEEIFAEPEESDESSGPDESSEPEESEDSDPEDPAAGLPGDVNGDGEITATDYMLLKRAVLGTYGLAEEQQLAADVNGDGQVTSVDYMLVKRHVLGTFVIQQPENP